MRSQRNIHSPFALRKPRSNTARTVAGELSLTPICIKEPQKELPIGPALEKLNAVCSYARIASAKLACEFSMATLSQGFIENEKVVTAGMCFYKGNHETP